MADYPHKGISADELIRKMLDTSESYKDSRSLIELYSDWSMRFQSALEGSIITPKDLESITFDNREFSKRVLEMIRLHERMHVLRELYLELEDDIGNSEGVDLKRMKKILDSAEISYIKPFEEMLFEVYPRLMQGYLSIKAKIRSRKESEPE